ncbi:MAG: hypothetical protein AB7T37_08410 [Dehalococcoidia bacterium]
MIKTGTGRGKGTKMTARYLRTKLALVAMAGAGIFAGTATLLASAQPADLQPAETAAPLSSAAIQDPTQAATGREATSTPTPAATSTAPAVTPTPAASATATASATVARTPAVTATSRARQSRGS